MPTSKIEAELSKATKVKHREGQDRQVFLKAMMLGVEKLDEDVWDALSPAAQKWYNEAVKTMNDKKPFKDFADIGKVKPGADDDEDDAPRGKKKASKAAADDDEDEEEDEPEEDEDEEEDEAPPAKKGAKKKVVEEDEEEEEDEAPKKKGAKKKVVEEEDEDEEEDEAPKKKKAAASPAKKSGGPATQGGGVKNRIKELVAADTDISVDDIVKKLGKLGGEVSKVTVTNVRAEFRHTLKFLKDRGSLKGISI